jgi:predicted Zn-dependent protease
MYSRDEIKALADSVLNMAKADAVEVDFNGGERSGTRWANSTITDNLVQLDQQVSVIVRLGQKTGSASTPRTTDFWGNLDAKSGKESWQMHGTGGDAKGQPTQTNSISHGSPFLRIKKMMVGAAYG